MIRLFANAKYDFIGVRRYAYIVTGVLLTLGLIALIVRGLNYSVEFTGGTLIRVETKAPIDMAQVRAGLNAQGIHGAEIQGFGGDRDYVIRARTAKEGTDADNTQETTGAVASALDQVLGTGTYTIARTEAVGPRSAPNSARRPFWRSCSASSRCCSTWPTASSGDSVWRRSSPPPTTSS